MEPMEVVELDEANFIRRPSGFGERSKEERSKSLIGNAEPMELRPYRRLHLSTPSTSSEIYHATAAPKRSRISFCPISRSVQDLVNPFTLPPSKPKKKSAKLSLSDILKDDEPLPLCPDFPAGTAPRGRKPRLSDNEVPRYLEDFQEIRILGRGNFGSVFLAICIANGKHYAIKKNDRPKVSERNAHREVYAHGALDHPNIVRNYSTWYEDGTYYLQNEYCNGGSLEDKLAEGKMDEERLNAILKNVTEGLRFMHGQNIAHLDIKPANIFITRSPRLWYEPYTEGEEDVETMYKIGDLGNATQIGEMDNVPDGDSRYLAKEMIRENYSNLAKVDIAALGFSLMELARGTRLPLNGDEWHAIRDGIVEPAPHISNALNGLIKRMVHPDPNMRPSAVDILKEISANEAGELEAVKRRANELERQIAAITKGAKTTRASDNVNRRTSLRPKRATRQHRQ